MFTKIGPKKNFPENKSTHISINGMDICVVHAVGNFYAFEDSCTHAQATLSGSDIENSDEISCPLHGAKFSVRTGRALTPPAIEPLKMFEVKIDGDDILINV